jgi:hypothetical protein
MGVVSRGGCESLIGDGGVVQVVVVFCLRGERWVLVVGPTSVLLLGV